MSARSYAGRLARLEALEAQRREREAGSRADRLNRARELREHMTPEQQRMTSIRWQQEYIRTHEGSTDPMTTRLVRSCRRGLAYLESTEGAV